MKQSSTYEVKLYIGSREGYNGRRFTEDELIEKIAEYQEALGENPPAMPVRVSPTLYMIKDYMERGWEVAAICYPRRPHSRYVIEEFMLGLGKFLLGNLKQNRISVLTPETTYMLESENPEERHDAPGNTNSRPITTG